MLCLRPDNSKAQQVKQTAAKAGKRQRLLVTPLLKDINSEPSAPSQAVSHVETSSKTSSSRSQHPATAVDDATMQAPSRTACGTIHPVKVADCTKSSSKSSASANKSSQHTSQHSSPLPADIQTPLHAAFITSPPAKLQMLDSDASSPAEGVGGCLLPIYGSTAPAEATPVPSSSHAGAGFTEPSTDLTAQTPPQLSHVNQHVSRPDPAFQSRLKFSRKPHMHSQTDEHCSQPANSAAQICGEHQPVAVVSDTPDRKQTGLKSLMAVQRLPAVLASSLPSVKDLAKDVKVPRAHVLIGMYTPSLLCTTFTIVTICPHCCVRLLLHLSPLSVCNSACQGTGHRLPQEVCTLV